MPYTIDCDHYTLRRICDHFGLTYCEREDVYAEDAVYVEDIQEYVSRDELDNEYYDYYRYCDICGRYFTADYFNDEMECCCECAESRRMVMTYHYHKRRMLTFGDRAEIGIELEVDGGNDREHAARLVNDIMQGHVVFEEDGSLSEDGFEIITHIHSIDALRATYSNWSRALDALRREGYRSHDAGNCGLHIHYNRALFGDTFYKQERNIEKLQRFYYENDAILERLSRRNTREYCERNESGHYGAVNVHNAKTIEIRMGRGTLVFDTFKAWVELNTYIVTRAIESDTDDTTNWNAWIDLDDDRLDASAREYIKRVLFYNNSNESEDF